MLTGERRAASVIATEDCDVLEIDQKVLQLLAQAFPAVGHSIARFYRDRLMNRVSYISPLFQSFPPNIRPRLAAQFALREVAADEVLIREGQPGEGLYVVVSGTALVSRVDPQGRARPVNLMVEGDVFGEISLLSGEPATATVTAKRRMIVLALPHRLFQHVVDAFPEVLDAALALWREREKHDRRLAGTHEHMSGLRRLALRV